MKPALPQPERMHRLFPIIVPRRYNKKGNWPGYLTNLKHPMLAVTHVWVQEDQTLMYLNREEHDDLAAHDLDCHAIAMENLRATSTETFYTHMKQVDGILEMVGFMNEDGLGTSRLLLLDRLSEIFPGGCRIGIPERSCGIVISGALNQQTTRSYEDLAGKCYENGNVPMLPGLFDPSQFEIAIG